MKYGENLIISTFWSTFCISFWCWLWDWQWHWHTLWCQDNVQICTIHQSESKAYIPWSLCAFYTLIVVTTENVEHKISFQFFQKRKHIFFINQLKWCRNHNQEHTLLIFKVVHWTIYWQSGCEELCTGKHGNNFSVFYRNLSIWNQLALDIELQISGNEHIFGCDLKYYRRLHSIR